MTLKELSQLYWLNREIERDRERLADVRSRAACPSAPNLSGMRGGTSDESRVERYVAEIVDLELIISAKLTQCVYERNRLERYISDIPDSLTRQIFQLRFIDGLNWIQISNRIGGGNSEEGVRKRVYRYLKSEK